MSQTMMLLAEMQPTGTSTNSSSTTSTTTSSSSNAPAGLFSFGMPRSTGTSTSNPNEPFNGVILVPAGMNPFGTGDDIEPTFRR